jgi:hypothetical protein
MIELYALWDSAPEVLERFLRTVLREAALVLERCLAEMPTEQMLWVDFEALRTDPASVLRQILQFTAAGSRPGDGSRGVDIAAALASVPIHPGKRASMPDDAQVRAFDRLMRAARRRFGSGQP